MGINRVKAWRGGNIFGNLSTKYHSLAKKLELSQMRLRYFFEIKANK